MEVIAVDWSGAKDVQSRLWLARAGEGVLLDLRSARSREEAIRYVVERAEVQPDLVAGFDFSFSLPAWFLESRGLTSARELWSLVAKEGESWLAECEPPFWGRPGKPRPAMEAPFRRTEAEIQAVGAIRPKSTFQIGGAGSVGTSSLRGMPFLLDLADAGFSIWPFDVPKLPLAVEIYPRFLTGPVTKSHRASRLAYLEQLPKSAMPEAMVDAVSGSEDAFDACISAIVMAQHSKELSDLRQVVDRVHVLEGSIWVPPSLAGEMTRW